MTRLGFAAVVLACAGLVGAGCTSTTTPHKATPPKEQASSTTSSTSSTVPASTSTSTSAAAAGSSTCASVAATAGQSQGAAGTITGVINIVDTSGAPCTMDGYPTMALFYAAGTTIPVTIVDGLTVDISSEANGPPTSITVSPSQGADFTYQYSDVPSGNETSCPSSTRVSVTPPGSSNGTAPIDLVLAPCDNGTIRVSPVYPGG